MFIQMLVLGVWSEEGTSGDGMPSGEDARTEHNTTVLYCIFKISLDEPAFSRYRQAA